MADQQTATHPAKKERVLKAGSKIRHYDDDPNGHTTIHSATVIRARGQGVLVERDLCGSMVKYRVPRSDVLLESLRADAQS